MSLIINYYLYCKKDAPFVTMKQEKGGTISYEGFCIDLFSGLHNHVYLGLGLDCTSGLQCLNLSVQTDACTSHTCSFMHDLFL